MPGLVLKKIELLAALEILEHEEGPGGLELREDGSTELREDGSAELREDD